MKQIHLFLVVGVICYLLDILTAGDRYKSCWNLQTQSLLLLHHIFFVFAMMGWLSTDRTLLKIYCLIIPVTLIHWYFNNDKCAWTQMVNEQCGTSGGLRTIFRVMNIGEDWNYRKVQKIWFTFGLIVAIGKLVR